MKILATLLLLPIVFLNFDFGLANSCRENSAMRKMSCCVIVVHCDSNAIQIGPPPCGCQIAKAPVKSPPATWVTDPFSSVNNSGKWLDGIVSFTQGYLNRPVPLWSNVGFKFSPNLSSEVKIYALNSSYLI